MSRKRVKFALSETGEGVPTYVPGETKFMNSLSRKHDNLVLSCKGKPCGVVVDPLGRSDISRPAGVQTLYLWDGKIMSESVESRVPATYRCYCGQIHILDLPRIWQEARVLKAVKESHGRWVDVERFSKETLDDFSRPDASTLDL